MDSKSRNIFKMRIMRCYAIKQEFKRNILKSVMSNFKANEISRIHAYTKYSKMFKLKSISRQKNICKVSGKNRGIYQPFSMARHWIKKYAKMSKLTNLKVKSW